MFFNDTADTRLNKLFENIKKYNDGMLGYPANRSFDYKKLFKFMTLVINNIGDPFMTSSGYKCHTHELERETLRTFGDLTKADHSDFWGYITNGGTEGNMYGLLTARNVYPDGVVYYSEDSHYSIEKILNILRMDGIKISSLENGEINYSLLDSSLKTETRPVIFLANIGSTMKGAVDNLDTIKDIFRDNNIKSYYIHCDSALSGMILPFVDHPQKFNFADGADSISISGHKMIGSPLPCGVVLAKHSNVKKHMKNVEYAGIYDTTLSGSRNGITPIILWYALNKKPLTSFKGIVKESLDLANYTKNKLNSIGVNTLLNKNSITIVFDRPSSKLVSKWQLAPKGELCHLITMPGVSAKLIDKFVDDLRREKL